MAFADEIIKNSVTISFDLHSGPLDYSDIVFWNRFEDYKLNGELDFTVGASDVTGMDTEDYLISSNRFKVGSNSLKIPSNIEGGESPLITDGEGLLWWGCGDTGLYYVQDFDRDFTYYLYPNYVDPYDQEYIVSNVSYGTGIVGTIGLTTTLTYSELVPGAENNFPLRTTNPFSYRESGGPFVGQIAFWYKKNGQVPFQYIFADAMSVPYSVGDPPNLIVYTPSTYLLITGGTSLELTLANDSNTCFYADTGILNDSDTTPHYIIIKINEDSTYTINVDGEESLPAGMGYDFYPSVYTKTSPYCWLISANMAVPNTFDLGELYTDLVAIGVYALGYAYKGLYVPASALDVENFYETIEAWATEHGYTTTVTETDNFGNDYLYWMAGTCGYLGSPVTTWVDNIVITTDTTVDLYAHRNDTGYWG